MRPWTDWPGRLHTCRGVTWRSGDIAVVARYVVGWGYASVDAGVVVVVVMVARVGGTEAGEVNKQLRVL
jgi:hypothetical protein